MPADPREQADLDIMKAKQQEIRLLSFDLAREYARMSPEELRHSGHKTNEGAVFATIQRAIRDCDKAAAEFLKKWPD